MGFVSGLLSLTIVAAKRLWHNRLLMLCYSVGLIVAVGLLSSIPLYSDAVHNRLLQGELTEAGVHRPPFAFLWRYVGAWHGEIPWDEYAPVDDYLTNQASAAIGLPVEVGVRHASTAKLRLFPDEMAAFGDDSPLIWANIGFISDLSDNIQLIEGEFPGALPISDAVDVIISQKTAELLGLQVGEKYTLFGSSQGGAQIPVQISGVWSPLDSSDPYWFFQPDAFDELLISTESQFSGQVVPALDNPVSTAVWYQILDGSRVRHANVGRLLDGVATAEARVTAFLNNTTLDASPAGALSDYGRAASELSLVLTIFSLPVIGIILFFIGMIASMVVRREASEIAIMRSRGMSKGQILGIYFLEGLFLGALGLAGGLLLGRWVAQLMGRTNTFLDPSIFDSNTEPLVTVLSSNAILYGLLAVGLAILALLIPAFSASRFTIINLRWQQSRSLVRPLWHRYYLDVLLLIPPLYGLYQLNQQGSLAFLGSRDDPFSNPLLFIVPILFCFGLGLFLVRFFPIILGGLSSITERSPFTVFLMTFRQLARSASLYTGPLILLCLTVSLAIFTASMAVTLDGHLHDSVYYQVGSDLSLGELGESTEDSDQTSLPGESQLLQSSEGDDEGGPRWLFLPVNEHLRVPGVEAAARVGDYTATTNIGGRQQSGTLLGIDRIDFANVAFFRPDFAENEPLGGLLNRLAMDRANILVSREFLARHGLAAGDTLRLTVGAAGDFADVEFIVAGPIDLFPTKYPEDGPVFVANLDYVHEGLGSAYPYNVWLSTNPTADPELIVDGVRKLGLAVVTAQDARQMILADQERPERQGLFGLLSVGFFAAAILTVLGFLVYAVASFQRRFIELGMLRAVGLSIGQMSGYLAGEQAILILSGVGLGTLLGVLASYLFIPYYQVGSEKADFVPPFIVQIAWGELSTIYAVFAIMFVIAVAALVLLLLRMRIFEAVKLGEAV